MLVNAMSARTALNFIYGNPLFFVGPFFFILSSLIMKSCFSVLLRYRLPILLSCVALEWKRKKKTFKNRQDLKKNLEI